MDHVTIKWEEAAGEKILRFVFYGKLTEEAAESAIEDWEQEFAKVDYPAIPIIWDCVEMSGYQQASARRWKETLTKHKHRIGQIWVITDNPLIKLGARAITMVSNFKLIPVSPGTEITIN